MSEASGSDTEVFIPMTDVFSNLLMLIIAYNPLLNPSAVNLPRWDGAAKIVASPTAAKQIEIRADGTILWDRQPCPSQALPGHLREAAARKQSVVMFLDRNVRFDAFWTCYHAYCRTGFPSAPKVIVSAQTPRPRPRPEGPATPSSAGKSARGTASGSQRT
jgi:biopolymer transport protein ExbD